MKIVRTMAQYVMDKAGFYGKVLDFKLKRDTNSVNNPLLVIIMVIRVLFEVPGGEILIPKLYG